MNTRRHSDRPDPRDCGRFNSVRIMNEEQTADVKTDQSFRLCSSNTGFAAGADELLVIKKDVSTVRTLGWDDDTEHLELRRVKEEEEELCIDKEEEQLTEPEELSYFTVVTVKSEGEDDGNETPLSSQLHQNQTEENEEWAGGVATQIKSETGENRHRLPSNTAAKISDCSETDDSYDWQEPFSNSGPEIEDTNDSWEETSAPESASVSSVGRNGVKTCCSLQRHGKADGGKRSSACRAKQKVDSQKPFGCDVCGKRFHFTANFRKHMRVHTGEKPFGCDFCSKRFTQHAGLKTHMRIHTGEKPFCCDDCGKTFSDQGNLMRHMRVHTGERPFGCDICGNRFAQRGSLKTHMRIHTGEKPFGCDVCGNRFNQQANLNKHMRVHTGGKPLSADTYQL